MSQEKFPVETAGQLLLAQSGVAPLHSPAEAAVDRLLGVLSPCCPAESRRERRKALLLLGRAHLQLQALLPPEALAP